ncbi:MAG: hypothetical protein GX358_03310 [candidate division WS1 bacterium]|nr:hypothetical protein [candidate division WS1 bacterium]
MMEESRATSDVQITTDAPPTHPQRGVNLAVVVLSVGFLAIGMAWIYAAGLVGRGAQVDESVPVIPAMAALMLLTLIAPLLRRLSRRLNLTQADVLLVYAFLCVAITCASVGVVRLLLPLLTVTQYFAAPDNDLGLLSTYLPQWAVPQDPTAIRDMYEGAVGEVIPWGTWVVPLLTWSFFFIAFFVSMLGVVTLFRHRWADKEHLTFPIVHLVVDISDQSGSKLIPTFFRSPVMWVGFSLAMIYNVMNILNAWNPAVPALGRAYNLSSLFTERPWSAIAPLSIAWRPENIGLGFLVSTEITFSVWVFYLLLRFSNVVATSAGYDISGFPFDQEQSAGAYLALGIFLIWVAREDLKNIAAKAFAAAKSDLSDDQEPMSYRWAIICAIGGFVAMLIFAERAGMLLWTAGIYFGLILLFALVYARARAEAGAAMVWLFPFYQHKRMMLYVAGSAPFAPQGSIANLTVFSMFMFISRGFYQSMMAYQLEASKIASTVGINQRAMAKWLIVALVLGLMGAYYVHMKAYYTHGANVLEGGTTQGGYRTQLAKTEYESTAGYLRSHVRPDTQRATAAGVGFVVTMILVLLRSVFLRFPLHPLGYAMVTSYGSPLWGPFFIVWVIKSIVLRVGGMRLYRQLIPLFIGIVLGHFFTAGMVWGWLNLFFDTQQAYTVHFG